LGKRDDFAWMLEFRRRYRDASRRQRPGGQGYESAEQIYERRVRRRSKLKMIIALILQIAIPLIIFLFLL
jgi:hypothetical protein